MMHQNLLKHIKEVFGNIMQYVFSAVLGPVHMSIWDFFIHLFRLFCDVISNNDWWTMHLLNMKSQADVKVANKMEQQHLCERGLSVIEIEQVIKQRIYCSLPVLRYGGCILLHFFCFNIFYWCISQERVQKLREIKHISHNIKVGKWVKVQTLYT